MPKNKLEEKILKNVYQYETGKTKELILEIVIAVVLILLGLGFFIFTFIQIVIERQSLDILHVLTMDEELFKKYFWEGMQMIYGELPQEHVLIISVLLVIFVIILIVIHRILPKITNKIKAIRKYSR